MDREGFLFGCFQPTGSGREEISSLVEKCLEAKGVGCEEYERKIDRRVAALYGL